MSKKSIYNTLYRFFTILEEILNNCFLVVSKLINHTSRNCLDNNQKVLINMVHGGIGDFILFTASLPAYRELFKDAHIILLVKENVANLAEMCPYVNEILCLREKKFRRNIIERLRWLKKMATSEFDIAINTAYSTEYRYLDCLIGWTNAPRRIAHKCIDTKRKRIKPGSYFTELVPADRKWKFEINRNFDLLRYLGYQGKVNLNTEVSIKKDDRLLGIKLKEKLENRPYAVLSPGALAEIRIWNANNFIKVVEKVYNLFPISWVICGGPSEIELCEYIAKNLTDRSIPVNNYAGKTTLRELTWLIQNAEFCLANETCAVHIAAAVNTPTICVLGGGHYGRFYPYPYNLLTIAVTNKLPCYNCYWNCILDEAECITKVRSEDALKAIIKLCACRQM